MMSVLLERPHKSVVQQCCSDDTDHQCLHGRAALECYTSLAAVPGKLQWKLELGPNCPRLPPSASWHREETVEGNSAAEPTCRVSAWQALGCRRSTGAHDHHRKLTQGVKSVQSTSSV